MKHIKKKFIQKKRLPKEAAETLINHKPSKEDLEQIDELKKNDFAGYVPYLLTDDEFIQAFKYKYKNKYFFIPEPHPIVIYFSNAQVFLKSLYESKEELLNSLQKGNNLSNVMNPAYRFFGFSSNFTTSLFNSLEAFINSLIPNDYIYSVETNRNTTSYNKAQIQRNISFDDKIKKVIPEITGKNFHVNQSHKFDTIKKFKSLRDKIVHTKADNETRTTYYESLYKDALDFNYKNAIKAIRDYINFYEEGLIEKCDCGNDY